MIKRLKTISKITVSLFSFSYILNFVWESFHSILYTCCIDMKAVEHLKLMAYASMIDALLILLMYSLIVLRRRDLFWIKNMKKESFYTFLVLGLIIATIIEYRALYIFHQWEYNQYMPTIFTIGLTPLVQLSITGLIALWITKRICIEQVCA